MTASRKTTNGDWTNLVNASLQRTFVVKERIKNVVRADAQSAQSVMTGVSWLC